MKNFNRTVKKYIFKTCFWFTLSTRVY